MDLKHAIKSSNLLPLTALKTLCVLCAMVSTVFAQDTRHVTEPVVPDVCESLTAQLSSENGKFIEKQDATLDTARIQNAIDHCAAGKAVELKSDAAHDVFLTAPIDLRPSVVLLVRAGATLYGTRNPRTYDVQPGSCGVVDTNGRGCRPLIHAEQAPHSGVMGDGVIDGQGGEKLFGQKDSWWDLAHQAKVEDKKQNCPRILQADQSDDFTLYHITLRNAPNYHAVVSRTDGFTAWGVKVDSPATARNTDGIDPSSSTNVTIAYSYIRAGDDNIAIKAGKNGPSMHMTFAHNHFYSGHGMSIGSETNGGVSAIRVYDLTIDGADNGLRIKSDLSRGGLVHDVSYQDVCQRDVKNPILMDPFYSTAKGELVPQFEDITLRNVVILGGGKITLQGIDAQHLLKMRLDGVLTDVMKASDIKAEHAHLEFTKGNVNFLPKGNDVQVAESGQKRETVSWNCVDVFVPFPEDVQAKTSTQETPRVYNGPLPEPKRWSGTRSTVTVAADGSGDYTSVQDGVDALHTRGGTVSIKAGMYREVVKVEKPNVHLVGLGTDPTQTVIVFGNSAASTGSTFRSPTVFVNGDDFYATNLTLQNDWSLTHEIKPEGSQAVALAVRADRAVFRKVRFLGAQDTLYASSYFCNTDTGPCSPTRQYFEDCYIEGHVDFIFGDSKAVFNHCEIHAIAHSIVYLTAQSKRYPEQPSGYIFDHCKITSDPNVKELWLGRSWRAYSYVVFMNTEMDGMLAPAGWREWHPGETERLKTAYYAEFNSTGEGARPSQRELLSKQLSEEDIHQYKTNIFLAGSDGWDPGKVK